MNGKSALLATGKTLLVVWFFSLLGFFLDLFIGTNGFRGTIQTSAYGSSPIFGLILAVTFLTGSITFVLGVFSIAIFYAKQNAKNKNGFIVFLKVCLILATFPIYLLFVAVRDSKIISKVKKKKLQFWRTIDLSNRKKVATSSLTILFIIAILLPLWLIGYLGVAAVSYTVAASTLGYKTIAESVSGTGSMYPTFPKGDGKTPQEQAKESVGLVNMFPYPNGLLLFGKRLFGHDLTRGDIVIFQNAATNDISQKMYGNPGGFIKRIIALAGDTIQLRGGTVYLNGKPLKEPYTARPQSTFGEQFLQECKQITVPPHKLFVMGDNRTGSGDSREFGFIDINDVNHVLPFNQQKGIYDKHWRDTGKDFDASSKITLNKDEYLALLNEKRKEIGVQPLKYQPKLEQTAEKRGEVILKFDDYSWEATRSGYTMFDAMQDVGYYNTVYGEQATPGYYVADELIDNQFQFPKTKAFLLDKQYQEIGIATVEGDINGCPTQVIVQHLAGYIPPNYSDSLIQSWETPLNQLKNIQGSWQNLKNNDRIYSTHKAEVDRINDIIATRISSIEGVVATMKANQWLSAAQNDYTKTGDKQLYDEQEALAKKLNSY